MRMEKSGKQRTLNERSRITKPSKIICACKQQERNRKPEKSRAVESEMDHDSQGTT